MTIPELSSRVSFVILYVILGFVLGAARRYYARDLTFAYGMLFFPHALMWWMFKKREPLRLAPQLAPSEFPELFLFALLLCFVSWWWNISPEPGWGLFS